MNSEWDPCAACGIKLDELTSYRRKILGRTHASCEWCLKNRTEESFERGIRMGLEITPVALTGYFAGRWVDGKTIHEIVELNWPDNPDLRIIDARTIDFGGPDSRVTLITEADIEAQYGRPRVTPPGICEFCGDALVALEASTDPAVECSMGTLHRSCAEQFARRLEADLPKRDPYAEHREREFCLGLRGFGLTTDATQQARAARRNAALKAAKPDDPHTPNWPSQFSGSSWEDS
jgi:hypothetical protein